MTKADSDQTDFTVKAEDAVAAGFCVNPGLRDFLETRGHSLRDFIRNGLPSSVVIGFNDAQSDRVLEKARERIRG